MQPSIQVRAEAPSDRRRIHALQSAAFGQAAEADLVDALRAAADPFVSLVAVVEGELVGHIAMSPVTLEGQPDAPLLGGVAPVGVEPARQGLGVGAALLRAAIERAPRVGWRALFLVGSPAYYARAGFARARPLGFRYGDPHMDEALQYLELEPGALAGLGGRVVFHPAFAATGTG